MYRCESRAMKKAECQRIDAFELWCWRRLLRVPWMARRSKQSILKEINPEYSLEGLMLKLKLRPPDLKIRLIGKNPDAGKDWRQYKKGMTEDKMVGCYHLLDGHEFESAPGIGEGQGSLVYCSPLGCKESGTTEWLHFLSLGYGKTQESGLTEITPLICTSAIWGQHAVFSHPELPQGSP